MVIHFKSIFFAPAKEETFWPEKRKLGQGGGGVGHDGEYIA